MKARSQGAACFSWIVTPQSMSCSWRDVAKILETRCTGNIYKANHMLQHRAKQWCNGTPSLENTTFPRCNGTPSDGAEVHQEWCNGTRTMVQRCTRCGATVHRFASKLLNLIPLQTS